MHHAILSVNCRIWHIWSHHSLLPLIERASLPPAIPDALPTSPWRRRHKASTVRQLAPAAPHHISTWYYLHVLQFAFFRVQRQIIVATRIIKATDTSANNTSLMLHYYLIPASLVVR